MSRITILRPALLRPALTPNRDPFWPAFLLVVGAFGLVVAARSIASSWRQTRPATIDCAACALKVETSTSLGLSANPMWMSASQIQSIKLATKRVQNLRVGEPAADYMTLGVRADGPLHFKEWDKGGRRGDYCEYYRADLDSCVTGWNHGDSTATFLSP